VGLTAMPVPEQPSAPSGPDAIQQTIALVADTMRRVAHGAVVITVHAGRIVQIDVVERTRLDQPLR